jgi:hypothetical protein
LITVELLYGTREITDALSFSVPFPFPRVP